MSTASESTTTSSNPYMEQYFDALLKSYDVLSEAIEKANERGLRVSRQLVADVAQGQREAIETSRKLVTEQANPAQVYGALLESAMNSQSRALAFTQTAYQEAIEASTDARETIEKIVEANQGVNAAATEASRQWFAANPFTEAIRQQFEAATGTSNS